MWHSAVPGRSQRRHSSGRTLWGHAPWRRRRLWNRTERLVGFRRLGTTSLRIDHFLRRGRCLWSETALLWGGLSLCRRHGRSCPELESAVRT